VVALGDCGGVVVVESGCGLEGVLGRSGRGRHKRVRGDGGSVPSYHGIDYGAAEDDAEGDTEVGVGDCGLRRAFGRCRCG
jgi:hypothetical protein